MPPFVIQSPWSLTFIFIDIVNFNLMMFILRCSQVLPYFVINKLGHLKGLPGMFTACLYGAALRYIVEIVS